MALDANVVVRAYAFKRDGGGVSLTMTEAPMPRVMKPICDAPSKPTALRDATPGWTDPRRSHATPIRQRARVDELGTRPSHACEAHAVTNLNQDEAARAALAWATDELGVELTVVGVLRRRRANTKTPFYEVTVRGAGGDDHVCFVDLDGHVFRFWLAEAQDESGVFRRCRHCVRPRSSPSALTAASRLGRDGLATRTRRDGGSRTVAYASQLRR
jgi:hypothetical protein